ncbi:hypothetical protein PISMIDRAFT_679586, partial [Pisolithus microcarpus 441]
MNLVQKETVDDIGGMKGLADELMVRIQTTLIKPTCDNDGLCSTSVHDQQIVKQSTGKHIHNSLIGL